MKKKLFFPAILVLVFGIAVVGCPDGSTSEEKDIWSDVTSLDQIDGTWKGSYSVRNQPIKDFLEEQDMWNPLMAVALGDMKASSDTSITTTIDAGAKTQAMSITSTITFSGGNIKTVWPLLKGGMESRLEEEGLTVTFNDATHSASIAESFPPEIMSEEYIENLLDSGMQINQNGKKIKMPENSLRQGMPEIIFTKH
jgi:hypothetical protein